MEVQLLSNTKTDDSDVDSEDDDETPYIRFFRFQSVRYLYSPATESFQKPLSKLKELSFANLHRIRQNPLTDEECGEEIMMRGENVIDIKVGAWIGYLAAEMCGFFYVLQLVCRGGFFLHF